MIALVTQHLPTLVARVAPGYWAKRSAQKAAERAEGLECLETARFLDATVRLRRTSGHGRDGRDNFHGE